MQRRDFVRAMVSATAVPHLLVAQNANPAPPPPAPVPWTTGLNAATPVPHTLVAESVAQGDLRFFTAVQMATLERLSDLLVPALGGKPGAIAAGVPAFLDFYVGCSPAYNKKFYQDGLNWLEGESQRQSSKPFAKLESPEADKLVGPWLRTWMSDHPPKEAHADFINAAHGDIRSATINSKAWSQAPVDKAEQSTPVGLYWSPIEPDIYADAPDAVRAMLHGTRTPA